MKVSRRKWTAVVVVPWVFIVVAVATGGVYWYTTQNASPLPANIQSKLTFSPFVLPHNSSRSSATNYKFTTVEDGTQILSYILRVPGSTISLSEYPQPSQFSDIPEYKDSFLSNVINQYATVQTSNGTIYLGHGVKQDNKQLGIMIERGLLVLMNPSKDLDQAQWRSIGDQLVIQAINS